MKVINLWGGPGVGKSTTRAGLFFLMRCKGLNVEEVTEYAKDLTYDKDRLRLADNWGILKEQARRVNRLAHAGVDYVVTDSPLPLVLLYAAPQDFDLLGYRAWSLYDDHENINFRIRRRAPYSPIGRTQTEAESLALCRKLDKLQPKGTMVVDGDYMAPETIYRCLKAEGHIPLR